MPPIDPDVVPHLSVPFMNEDHDLEVRLVNDVEAALEEHVRTGGPLARVVERMSILAVHTRDHFLREESLMRQAGFPAYAQHKAEHDRILAEMDVEARRFRDGGDAARLSRYVSEALPAWFVNHLHGFDEATARFSASAGELRA